MKISALKGIGDKTEKLFNKLGLYEVEDLITFFPRTYDVFEAPVPVSEMTEEKTYAFEGTIITSCEINTLSKYKVLSVYAADDFGKRIKLTWFNMPFLKSNLKKGYRYIFRGKVAIKGSLVFMEQPGIYSRDEYGNKMNSMQPVYRLTAGLTNNTVKKAVLAALSYFETLKEYLPQDILTENDLIDRDEAIRAIHFPHNEEMLKAARKRIVFDEFFLFTMSVKSLKNANLLANNSYIVKKSSESARILANLGYELTNAQKRVYDELLGDMSGPRTMNRLIQGDVGSGKTILAFLALIDTCSAGYQGILMAPTEVLAKQHFSSLTDIIEQNSLPYKCVLMTGSLSATDKKKAHEMAASGEADIIIGTHAVITDGTSFNNPGLVVTDEQHRFGVKQRESLYKKGANPHVLVMSATPIPRSLAIILYGDLDISIVDEKPLNRLPIKNCIVDDSYRPNAYRFIKNELEKGHQAYIICAMAREDDESDLENVEEYSRKIKKEFPPDTVIAFLHGKMKPSEKNSIMERFAAGEIHILVSTTVVEVGINVPNATVMMIENAERFGLAGLHQLRGRVGRGSDMSYCIFVSNSKNEITMKRLHILKESNDGFYIAEQDLKLRGPGDMLGTRQSGDFDFQLGDIFADAGILKLSADAAARILSKDPGLSLPENADIRKKLTEYMNSETGKINL